MKSKSIDKGTKISKRDEERTVWPSRIDCGSCWQDSNKQDNSQMYLFLKDNYWPSGVHNFRYVVLDEKHEEKKEAPEEILKPIYIFLFALIQISIIIQVWKKFRLLITGRHKKVDNIY